MYTAIGPHNAILNVGRTPFKELRVAPHHKFAVVGAHHLRVIFEGRALAEVVAKKEAQIPRRVEDLTCYQIAFPTTGVAKRLRLPQNPLALPKRFLRPLALAACFRLAQFTLYGGAHPRQFFLFPKALRSRLFGGAGGFLPPPSRAFYKYADQTPG